MNRARLITYEQVGSEIQAYFETIRSPFAFKTVAAKNTSDPIDVDSIGKGGKNGKREGKGQHQSQNPNQSNDVVCWHCGKRGHLSTEETQKSVWVRWSPQQRRQRKTEERHRQRSRFVGTGITSCNGGTAAATSSCEHSGLGVV